MNAPYHTKALPDGTVLREWKLEQVLGVGGFGIVYRGRGVYFDDLVAIKEYFPSSISDRLDGTTVTPTDSSSEEIYALGLSKFVEEAKILWNLSQPERHPNIASVRSLFEVHGTAYMVMDFEQGVSLSQMLKDGRRFDEASLMATIRPIAEGLDRAHQAGVVHRDIKPANILVDPAGRPVLIDFGSARFESGQATSTKVTFYTPPYAALEQYVKTYPQGPWTDIYALGVTLYQCVTGEKPAEVLERMHGGADEALSAREWPGYSRDFLRWVDAAMTVRPADRPQSIGAWFDSFGAPEAAPVDEDATRISAPLKLDPELTRTVTAAMATPAAPAAAAPAVAAEPEEAPAQRPGWLIPAAAGAALVAAVGAAAVLFMGSGHHAAPTAQNVVSGAAPAVAGGVSGPPAAGSPAAGANAAAVVQAAQSLLGEAQRAGRPGGEIAALTRANGAIAALGGQVQGPDAAAKMQQLNGLATSMAGQEARALSRLVSGQWQEADRALSGGGAAGADQALASLHGAKSSLDSDAALARGADPVAGLGAAGRALTDYAAFEGAYTAATPYFVAVKQAKLKSLISDGKAYEAQVVSLAAGPAPWLFAGDAKKQAYKTLQSNAAQAKTEAAQLDQLSSASGSGVDAALAQATSLKSQLGGLYSSSLAAHSAQSGAGGSAASKASPPSQ